MQPLFMHKLDWYIIRKFLSTFFFAILILAVISCVIDYSEKVDNIVQKHAPFWVVANYYKNFVPHITALLFPLFIFIATIFFTSKLAYKSEIIAILSSGVSFTRFLRPYAIGGGFLCIMSFALNHWVIPVANKQRIDFENTYINDGNYKYASDNLHLGIAKGTYVYLQNFNFGNYIGNRFSVEKIEGTMLKEKIMANYVVYDTVKQTWTLHDVVIRTNDSLHEKLVRVPEMTVKYPFSPRDLNRGDAIREALTTPQLNEYVKEEQMRGQENLSNFFIEKERRTAQPFAGFVLTIIGACIACRKIRGGSGLHLALGIALSAIYVMFMQLSSTFATKADLDPMIAMWIPNIVFGALAVVLYRRQMR